VDQIPGTDEDWRFARENYRLTNVIEVLGLLMLLFRERFANRNGATKQFTVGLLSDTKTSP
jgi:hypothetical protein